MITEPSDCESTVEIVPLGLGSNALSSVPSVLIRAMLWRAVATTAPDGRRLVNRPAMMTLPSVCLLIATTAALGSGS